MWWKNLAVTAMTHPECIYKNRATPTTVALCAALALTAAALAVPVVYGAATPEERDAPVAEAAAYTVAPAAAGADAGKEASEVAASPPPSDAAEEAMEAATTAVDAAADALDVVTDAMVAAEEAIDGAEEALQAEAGAEALEDPTILGYREAIVLTESQAGAYAASLSEQLLGLARVLQQQGRYDEALPLLKRGVHLSRINYGLYGEHQIPLLRAEIESLLALRDFSLADERHAYLWRVQQKTFGDDFESRLAGMLAHAEWQRQAYALRLDADPQKRLMSMWQLYRDAITLVAEVEGDYSNRLSAPLQGLFVAQYLISAHRPGETGGFEVSFGGASPYNRLDQQRFNSARSGSYRQGDIALLALLDVERIHAPDNNPRLADIQVLRGDWALLHNRRDAALEAYRSSLEELSRLDEPDAQHRRLFGEPTPLPTINPLQTPYAPEFSAEGRAVVSYDVNERGQARNVKVVEADSEESAKVARLIRDIKGTLFRPRFENGEPVATTEITKSYAY